MSLCEKKMEGGRNKLLEEIGQFDRKKLAQQTTRVTQLGDIVEGVQKTGWRSFGNFAVFGTANSGNYKQPKGGVKCAD